MGEGTRRVATALMPLLVAAGCAGEADEARTDESATTVAVEPATGPAVATGSPEFDDAPCPRQIPAAEGFRCGTVVVPERRDDPASPTIELAVAVLPAPEPGRHDDPMVVVDRMESTLHRYESVAPLPERIGRDVIILDIRGTGFSTPVVHCDEVDYRWQVAEVEPTLREPLLDAVRECRDRLEAAGVDLTAYTVEAIADDYIDVRRALGYSTWNVLGYGQTNDEPGATSSEVVFELMRRDGDAIRSIVLESPAPAQLDPWTGQVENVARAIEALIAACQEQAHCEAAHPDLHQRIVESLRAPRTDHAATSAIGEPMTVAVGQAFASFHYARGMAIGGLVALMPSLVNRPPDEVAGVVAANLRPVGAGGEGQAVLLSVACPMTGSDTMPADRAAETELGVLSWGLFPQADLCDRWTVADPNPVLDEPVVSDIPTLILTGALDPYNNIAGSRLVSSTLSNVFVFEIPSVSVNPLGSHADCAREIRNAFVDAPDREPDSRCLATVPPIAFSL
jgi:pimeloyl-ACP methyl ester carboxylesterase